MFKGLSNLANLGAMLKQAHEMRGRMEGMGDALKSLRATGFAGDGQVSIEMNGLGEVLSCRIAPALSGEANLAVLEELIKSAVNEAAARARELQAEAMQSLSAGVDVPGLNDMMAQAFGSNGPPSA